MKSSLCNVFHSEHTRLSQRTYELDMANSSLPMSLPYVSAIQATLQGPTPSIRYEAASENNDKRYEDRAGFEGFEVRLPVWERRSEARRVECRSGVPVGADAPPTEAPPTTAPCAPSLHRRSSPKRLRPCPSSRRSTAEVTNPVQRVQRVQRCPCERRWQPSTRTACSAQGGAHQRPGCLG